MLKYLLHRVIFTIIVLFMVSIVSFIIIQLPPGNWLDTYISNLEDSGEIIDEATIEHLQHVYGMDLPLYQQYLKWIGKIIFKGDWGQSFSHNMPVKTLVINRLSMTVFISILSLIFVYIVAVPIGIYSATHQYSAGDYTFTFFGFIGLATPNFLFALVLMVFFIRTFGLNVGGLFSAEFMGAPLSWKKFVDFLLHLPIPVIVVGTAGTAGMIRVMRGTLLDELQKQYVVTARAKGVNERKLLFKYPVRVAINPIVSTIGWTLPDIVSGSTITSIVLGLPTVGPLLYDALKSQDMYLAGSITLFLSFLTVIGTIISDFLLVAVDPRIRMERKTLT